MANERFERFYRPEQTLAPDEAEGQRAADAIRSRYETGLDEVRRGNAASALNHARILIKNVLIGDRMGRTRIKHLKRDLEILGRAEFIRETLRSELIDADNANNSDWVLGLIRASHLFSYDESPRFSRNAAQKAEAERIARENQALWEKHYPLWHAAQATGTAGTGTGGTAGAGPTGGAR